MEQTEIMNCMITQITETFNTGACQLLFIVLDRALARVGCAVLMEGEVDPSTAKQREPLKLDECRKIFLLG